MVYEEDINTLYSACKQTTSSFAKVVLANGNRAAMMPNSMLT